MQPDTLTQAELAKAIGVGLRAITLWRRSGMPYRRTPTGGKVYDKRDVSVWLEREGRTDYASRLDASVKGG